MNQLYFSNAAKQFPYYLLFYRDQSEFIYILTCENLDSKAAGIIYLLMSANYQGDNAVLYLKAVTWQKDSHSLFDYEFNKNVVQGTKEYPLNGDYIYIYRNNATCEITFETHYDLYKKLNSNLQLLLVCYAKEENKKWNITFLNSMEVRQKQSARGMINMNEGKQEEVYLIVRSLKNKNNENKGYKLSPGQIIKLGRVQYLVSTINNNSNQEGEGRSKFWENKKKIIVAPQNPSTQNEPLQCKYCMLGEGTQFGEFLCQPCKCSGSCGLVHFHCLEKWNQSKVKKQVIGGTIQYNFEKFYCQVCNEEYPRFIEKNGVSYELLPIQKPKGTHLILEGVSQRANNMMVIQNIPEDGIKIGRGPQCQIRITDISVSRAHAKIQKKDEDYYIFDNKSKFGTLVKEQELNLQLSKIKQGIQIGRTVMTFQRLKK